MRLRLYDVCRNLLVMDIDQSNDADSIEVHRRQLWAEVAQDRMYILEHFYERQLQQQLLIIPYLRTIERCVDRLS